MEKTLGIFVCTKNYFDHVLGLARAGQKAGVAVSVFFTGDAVALSQHPSFAELAGICKVKLCDVSYRRLGFEGVAPGLDQKAHGNQMDHALMVADADRYVVF